MVGMGVTQQDGFRLKCLDFPQRVCTAVDQDAIFHEKPAVHPVDAGSGSRFRRVLPGRRALSPCTCLKSGHASNQSKREFGDHDSLPARLANSVRDSDHKTFCGTTQAAAKDSYRI